MTGPLGAAPLPAPDVTNDRGSWWLLTAGTARATPHCVCLAGKLSPTFLEDVERDAWALLAAVAWARREAQS